MAERADVVVIGAGQAGLSTSHELTRAGVDHVILERERVGASWGRRWDSFCLVTPNWSVQLPGGHYEGPDPDGFMRRDELVEYMRRYARSFDAPVREGVDVLSLDPAADEGVMLETSDGTLRARFVVVTTGAYQRPHRPAAAASLPTDLLQIDADDYRNPEGLPDGRVLVVGSGQTGCQIAEELMEAGREVFVSCGRAPWVPRRLGDRDIVWWVTETGFMDQRVEALPSPQARLTANIQNTGRNGGYDLSTRTIRAAGATLVGHLAGADARTARFAPDLAESVAWGDARNREIMDLIRTYAAERGLPTPEIPEAEPFEVGAPEEVALSGFGAVVFASGYRPDYARWIRVPDAFDDLGFPIHREGQSTVAPGLFFVGVHFLRTRRSSLLFGVGQDAAVVAGQIAS